MDDSYSLYAFRVVWSKGCLTLQYLAPFVSTEVDFEPLAVQVRDVEDIRCCDVSSGRLAGQAIYRLLKSDLCPQPTNWTNVMLDALNGIMAFLILAIVAKLLRDYWRQKRTGKLPTFFGFV